MGTYSKPPTSSWNLPAARPLHVLLTTVAVVTAGWLLLAPGPDGNLTPADVDGPWPFTDLDVAVFCAHGSAAVELDGVRYALTPQLRGRPELQTLDLDTPDDVWLRRDNGVKVSLGPVTAAASDICAGT